MDALVLGGTWFIGLHLVRALSERGDRVTVLDSGVSRFAATCAPTSRRVGVFISRRVLRGLS